MFKIVQPYTTLFKFIDLQHKKQLIQFRLQKTKGAAFSTFFNCAIHDWNPLPNEKKHVAICALSMEC